MVLGPRQLKVSLHTGGLEAVMSKVYRYEMPADRQLSLVIEWVTVRLEHT